MVDIGAIGENAFAFWCSQAGLTANLVRKDVYGWDFYVQFPRTETHQPLDARPPQMMCMVQVKTTAMGATNAPIKLDNWERMVNEPLPWFVFALSLDGVTPSKAHLVHISKEHTERVLRRLRELRKSEPDADLTPSASAVTSSHLAGCFRFCPDDTGGSGLSPMASSSSMTIRVTNAG